MKIVDRYTIRAPILYSIVLVIFTCVVYRFYNNYRQNEFFKTLQHIGIIHQELYYEILSQKGDLLTKMDAQKSVNINQETTIIYDLNGKIVYKSPNAISRLQPSQLKSILAGEKINVRQGDFSYSIYLHQDNNYNRKVILQVSGFDRSGISLQKYLRNLLIISVIVIFVFIGGIARFFAIRTVGPISKIANRMEHFTENNLTERLPEAELQDEIGQMATTFNRLLDRLEKAYAQQQNFVSYTTHELRTPLTIMLGNTEVTLLKKRTPEEYEKALETIREETRGLIKLVNDLLELAHASATNQAIDFQDVRIDDVLWVARTQLLQKSHNYYINIEFVETPESEEKLYIKGNASLLRLAFINLMDNACKYNDEKTVDVWIKTLEDRVEIIFEDSGDGISPEDLSNIFEPYYRSTKVQQISGHGIGLPLTKKIINIHNGECLIDSKIGKGTTVKIWLPY